jgi:transcriptional regulator with XRE-family HTH domain
LPFCHLRLKAAKPQNPAYPKKLKTIGDHIRKRRLDLGRDVATRIGFTEPSVWNWESNASAPHWHSLKAIVDFLGYDPLGCGSFAFESKM